MELFALKATVHMYDTFGEFGRDFNLCETDLILTEKVIWQNVISHQALPCQVMFKDDYSSAEPDEDTVNEILQRMKGKEIHRVIAVGGGSVIDIGKVICVRDAYPVAGVMAHEVPPIHDKDLIVVPSTCGTGSEVTYGGIITMKDTGLKTAIMDSTLVAKHAVLIPEMIKELPYRVFVHCSVDALGHAMESYVSATRGNEFARAAGGRAIKLLMDGYAQLAIRGESAKADLLTSFIQASCLAGMAVNNGGAGPVHALAYPLGEVYHMSHGESIYQFLTEVFRYYERVKGGELLAEVGQLLQPALRRAEVNDDSPFDGLETLLNRVYPNRPLSACGMKEEDILPFTANVFAAKQRLLAAAYAPFPEEAAVEIYRHRL